MSLLFQCFLSLLALQPPVAEKIPHIIDQMQEERIDNYFWLREENNPKVIKYLEAENAYTKEMTKQLQPLEDELYEEMKLRTKQDDQSVPVKKGEYFYYTRWEEGKSYPLHCRKIGSQGIEEVYFDENIYASQNPYFSLEALAFSPDQKIVAYSIDDKGSEFFTLKFKNLSTNITFDETLYPTLDSAVFAADNKTVFYLAPDDAERPNRLFRHTLGTDPKTDQLLFEEKDPLFSLAISKSRDEKYLFLRSSNNMTSVSYYLKADDPQGTFEVILPKREKIKYGEDHRDGRFFLLINDTSKNFRIISLDVNDLHSPPQEVIEARENVSLDSFAIFENFLVLEEMKNALPHFEVLDFESRLREQIPFYEVAYMLRAGENPDFHSTQFRFEYSSFVTPPTVFDYDMQTHKMELKKKKWINHYDPSEYVEERFFATSHDGVEIPISLCYKKNAPKKALLLNGYGAYGYAYPVSFSAYNLSLLERGVAVAIAHVRGGGEYGRAWYDAGRMFHKKNTFYDFIACAEYLIEKGYATPHNLVIEGRSAGGLLMGAVSNMRPDLFKGVLALVPFVDVINTMSDPLLRGTTGEYEEWGNPAIEPQFRYMMSYSPYENVFAKPYPLMLITGGLNDRRVRYWEPAKLAAKLRATKTDDHLLFLKTQMGSGHFGASGRYDAIREQAFIFSFIIHNLTQN